MEKLLMTFLLLFSDLNMVRVHYFAVMVTDMHFLKSYFHESHYIYKKSTYKRRKRKKC